MADLDVSDVLDDPDFNTPITVLSSVEQVGSDGLAVAIEIVPGGVVVMAVVIPDGGRDLIQSSAGDMIQGDITVYTRYPLTTGSRTREPDVVFWNGDSYRIIQAKPWLFGDGYTQAICKLATIEPADPLDTPGVPAPAPGGGFYG
ncbi:hypothetical protein LOK46_10595 [Methylobacterium sp. NMS14P]|uniref:hypothetical protein n=1 Tax=Methylobacterium sp. NMS14P TaxID=2894310 RepID=UPI002358F6CC|nr:hypothetical protein [Methylobacterium sp. NMS14P]WCS27238.1 hypothetical protein LOK46_10595 [Methylobacterium sp. NMS14P]